MLKRLKTLRGAEDGFTLVELLVVIVILGILSAVVVFSVRGITDTGGKSACASTQSSITTASEAFRAQNPAYPISLDNLTTAAAPYLNVSQNSVVTTTTTSVIKDKATNPNWTLTAAFTAAAPPTFTLGAGC